MTNRPGNVKSNLLPSAKHWFSWFSATLHVCDCMPLCNSRYKSASLLSNLQNFASDRHSETFFLIWAVSMLIKNDNCLSTHLFALNPIEHQDATLERYLNVFCVVYSSGWAIPRSRQCTRWWASGWCPSSCPRCQLWAGTTPWTASTPQTVASSWPRSALVSAFASSCWLAGAWPWASSASASLFSRPSPSKLATKPIRTSLTFPPSWWRMPRGSVGHRLMDRSLWRLHYRSPTWSVVSSSFTTFWPASLFWWVCSVQDRLCWWGLQKNLWVKNVLSHVKRKMWC